MSVSVYSCLNCGGGLKYDVATKAFLCDYCKSSYTLEQLNAAYPDEDGAKWTGVWEEAQKEKAFDVSYQTNAEVGETVVQAYNCPSCGAEVMADGDTMAAGFCAFCGSPVTVSEKLLTGKGLPSLVIPFAQTREQAFAVLEGKMKGKPLLPIAFRKLMKADALKSIYVPFQLYDADCSGGITARCENVTHWSDGEYNYTKTDTYEARRSGGVKFEKVPLDASDKIDDAAMRAIEPFTMTELEPFSSKYLAGHYAEAPTTGEGVMEENLYLRLKPATEQALLSTVSGYDRVSLSSSAVSVEKAVSEYAMFPVWMAAATFKGKEHVFTVNGQTGKLDGKFPVDWGAAGLLFLKLFGIAFVLAFLALEVYLWVM